MPPADQELIETDSEDPLFGACQAAADALRVPIVRPPGRVPNQCEFADVIEIARASRLRVRRTLLRGNWWTRDVGPLVAWHGEARNPVALVRSRRRG